LAASAGAEPIAARPKDKAMAAAVVLKTFDITISFLLFEGCCVAST
jgi:hypothetical protein